MLADTLRTDRARLRPLVPDGPATTALRATCRARRDLVAHRVAVAADIYYRAISRGKDHPHPVRILARAWLYVIWRCWQENSALNPANHRALQALQQSAA